MSKLRWTILYDHWNNSCNYLGLDPKRVFTFREIELDYNVPSGYRLNINYRSEAPSPGAHDTGIAETVHALYNNRHTLEGQIAVWILASLKNAECNSEHITLHGPNYDLTDEICQTFPFCRRIWPGYVRTVLPAYLAKSKYKNLLKKMPRAKRTPEEVKALKLFTRRPNTKRDLVNLAVLECEAFSDEYEFVHFDCPEHTDSEKKINAFDLTPDKLLLYTQAANIISRYQRLQGRLPLNETERESIVDGTVQRIRELFSDNGIEVSPEEIKDTVYKMPRINLGPVMIGTNYSSIDSLQSISYEIEYFLGDNPNLRNELFMRVFMRNFDGFRTPEGAEKFLDALRDSKSKE